MLAEIEAILMAKKLISSMWQSEMDELGRVVSLYREYYQGKHRLKLTAKMKEMMQISDTRLDRYNANYCKMVVNSMAGSLTVDTIQAKTSSQEKDNPAQAWVNDRMDINRFDALQIDVRTAALRDGLTFIMAEYDKNLQKSILYHEPAWDGNCGTMVVYDRQGRKIVAGIKVWYEGDYRRANIYYQSSLERYKYEKVTIEENGQKREDYQLTKMGDPEDITRDGQLPGVPIIPFYNQSSNGGISNQLASGMSELEDVIPPQDSLNSTLQSMVMTALLTAFSMLFAKGFEPPSGITPGFIFHAMVGNVDFGNVDSMQAAAALNDSYGLERIQPGDMKPLIETAEFFIKQIGAVSLTPVPGLMGGDSQSGEALQERKTGQLEKVKTAQVLLGNSWEDVFTMIHIQETLFGFKSPPPVEGFNTRWKSAQVRNDKEIRETAKLANDMGFTRESLRILSSGGIVQYSEEDINRLMAEKASDAQLKLGDAIGETDGFSQFNFN